MTKKMLAIVAIVLLIATGCAVGFEETLEAPPTTAVSDSPAEEVTEAPVEDDEPADTSQEATEEPATDDAIDEPSSPGSVADLFTAAVTARGQVMIVTGRVLDVNGNALPGAAVEFWQTDEQGIYDHPGDAGLANRDQGFQFYGTSVTDPEGIYIFRTILPGEYEPRPPHIHVKVKVDGLEVLVTQYYFVVGGGVGGSNENLVLALMEEVGSDGNGVLVARYDLVVNTGIGSGSMRLTDSQGEGPFYPVVDVSVYDNDLASVE